MAGCLDGIRVLELARYQAGPRGGMVLSDLGAEVIKLEKIGGEETRKSCPAGERPERLLQRLQPWQEERLPGPAPGGRQGGLLGPAEDGRLRAGELPPGTMAKMGLDYDSLCKVKPDIILLSASAFGQYGPYRERPGFDPIGQAMSGLMMLTGQPVGQPLGTASSIVDRYTALHLTIGALAALRHRDRTGEGQAIDVCLMDSALTMVEIPTSYYLSTGQEGGEGGRPPYRAKDGWVIISASSNEMSRNLLEVIGQPVEPGPDGTLSAPLVGQPLAGRLRLVRRPHRRRDLPAPRRAWHRGGTGALHPRGGEGPPPLGARDAGQDGGPGRRRDVPAGPDDQVLQDARQARAGPDARPAHRRDPRRPAWLRRGPDRLTPRRPRDLREAEAMIDDRD